ncbi:MAG: hypothetical protein ABSF83_04500 [Nitrososphaerales archaeon]
MSNCKLCEKEGSVLSITGMQIPVGERCYTKLVNKDVVWEQETKLKKLEEMLDIG